MFKSALGKLDISVKQVASRVTVIEAKTETLEKSTEEFIQENKDLNEEIVQIGTVIDRASK